MIWNELIARQPGLAEIPGRLMERATYREMERGRFVFRAGDRVQNMLYVVSGEVRLVRWLSTGGEVILQRARGGFLAEASLGHRADKCDAVAAEDCAVLCFPVKEFSATLDLDPAFHRAWADGLAKEVRKLRAQCERLGLRSAAERVLHYIAAEGGNGTLVLNQSRKAWAAELGLTHEALYRTLARLRADGTLHIEGERLTLSPRVSSPRAMSSN